MWRTAWDGAPRLDTFFQDYFKTPGEARGARRFFGALAASEVTPARSQSDVPVLVGAAADVAVASSVLDTLSHLLPSSIAFVDSYAHEGDEELLSRGEQAFAARSGVFAVVRAPSVEAAKVSPESRALYIRVGRLGARHGDSARRRLAENRSQLLAEARVRLEGPASLREYLLHLQWDGISRLPSWLTTYGGAQDYPQTRRLAVSWPLAQVRTLLEGGPAEAPLFGIYGDQAIGKSRLISTFMQPLTPHASEASGVEVEGTWTSEGALLARTESLVARGWVPVVTHHRGICRPPAGVQWIRINAAPDLHGLGEVCEQLWAEAVCLWGLAVGEGQSATQASESVLHDCPELCKALARPDVQKLLARPGVDSELADMLVFVAGARAEGPGELIGAVLQHMEDSCDA